MRNEETERQTERGIQNHSLSEIYDNPIARPLGMTILWMDRAASSFLHRLRYIFRAFPPINERFDRRTALTNIAFARSEDQSRHRSTATRLRLDGCVRQDEITD